MGLSGKPSLEVGMDGGEGEQNGLKVVELETEVETGSETPDHLALSAEEPGAAAADPPGPPASPDVPPVVEEKEDPSQGEGAGAAVDPHLTSQDLRRAKRIRVSLQQLWLGVLQPNGSTAFSPKGTRCHPDIKGYTLYHRV